MPQMLVLKVKDHRYIQNLHTSTFIFSTDYPLIKNWSHKRTSPDCPQHMYPCTNITSIWSQSLHWHTRSHLLPIQSHSSSSCLLHHFLSTLYWSISNQNCYFCYFSYLKKNTFFSWSFLPPLLNLCSLYNKIPQKTYLFSHSPSILLLSPLHQNGSKWSLTKLRITKCKRKTIWPSSNIWHRCSLLLPDIWFFIILLGHHHLLAFLPSPVINFSVFFLSSSSSSWPQWNPLCQLLPHDTLIALHYFSFSRSTYRLTYSNLLILFPPVRIVVGKLWTYFVNKVLYGTWHMQKPKIFTLWFLTEKVCCLLN